MSLLFKIPSLPSNKTATTSAGMPEWVSVVEEGDLHIHILHFKEPSGPADRCASLLSPNEQLQYNLLSPNIGSREFLLSRLMLRRLLAGYLDTDMRDLKFDQGIWGKPFVKDESLQFNLSHTEGLIACSFNLRPVGIDVEKIDPLEKNRERWQLLAEHWFTPVEREYLNCQPIETKSLVFSRIFTMKEAHVKALGLGLRLPLDRFSIPLPLEGRSKQGCLEYFSWVLDGGDYCLANAVESPDHLVHYRIYPWDESGLVKSCEDLRLFRA
jgi:4'-phosphopantetheinyl transferase